SRLVEGLERKSRAEEAVRLAAARSEDVGRELSQHQAGLDALGTEASGQSLEASLEAARALGNLEHQARMVQAQLEDRQTALAASEVPDEPAPVEQWTLGLVASVA